jgi:hypothetical protein
MGNITTSIYYSTQGTHVFDIIEIKKNEIHTLYEPLKNVQMSINVKTKLFSTTNKS